MTIELQKIVLFSEALLNKMPGCSGNLRALNESVYVLTFSFGGNLPGNTHNFAFFISDIASVDAYCTRLHNKINRFVEEGDGVHHGLEYLSYIDSVMSRAGNTYSYKDVIDDVDVIYNKMVLFKDFVFKKCNPAPVLQETSDGVEEEFFEEL